jgi:hypothetical protein
LRERTAISYPSTTATFSPEFGSIFLRLASIVSWQGVVSFRSSLMFAFQATIFSWKAFTVVSSLLDQI